MEDFERKVRISGGGGGEEVEELSNVGCDSSRPSVIVALLRSFLQVQQRRAQAYSKLKRYAHQNPGIVVPSARIVLKMESLLLSPDCFRDDLASLLRSVQTHEQKKLHLKLYKQLSSSYRDAFKKIIDVFNKDIQEEIKDVGLLWQGALVWKLGRHRRYQSDQDMDFVAWEL
ncbi:hypothetical protein RJ640_006485 [Escallonia rubra]|uniref:Uncharacterized protein n=1 Tax=Escallonia rubra TaxID=112253 RepID=A0AA88R9S4_9ASTE|nr:hypothetical protein RJ640_006485 [Escallonia rubra]